MTGARRVENLFPSADFTSSNWGKSSLTATLSSITESATTANHQLNSVTGSTTAGQPHIFSIEVKPNGRDYVTISWFNSGAHFAAFSLLGNGSVISNQTYGIGSILKLSDGYFRLSFLHTPTLTTAGGYGVNIADAAYPTTPTPSYLGDGVSGLLIRNPQLENVTGQSYQTASEYVSSTESSTGALGVKYFETDYVGNPIPAATLKGVSVEPDSQNVLFPSATLATQSQTVTAGTWTLSFYGIGSVVMSGTATGTLAGTGASNLVQLTVTATAGSVTFTVTGSVTKAQFEPLPYASGQIATTTAAVARTKDILTIPTAGNLVAAQGAILITFTPEHNPIAGTYAVLGSVVDASNSFVVYHDGTSWIFSKTVAGVTYTASIVKAYAKDVPTKILPYWGATGFNVAVDGVIGTPHANAAPLPLSTVVYLGSDGAVLNQAGGNFKTDYNWTTQLTNAQAIGETL